MKGVPLPRRLLLPQGGGSSSPAFPSPAAAAALGLPCSTASRRHSLLRAVSGVRERRGSRAAAPLPAAPDPCRAGGGSGRGRLGGSGRSAAQGGAAAMAASGLAAGLGGAGPPAGARRGPEARAAPRRP